jgi:hypothetical protein
MPRTCTLICHRDESLLRSAEGKSQCGLFLLDRRHELPPRVVTTLQPESENRAWGSQSSGPIWAARRGADQKLIGKLQRGEISGGNPDQVQVNELLDKHLEYLKNNKREGDCSRFEQMARVGLLKFVLCRRYGATEAGAAAAGLWLPESS